MAEVTNELVYEILKNLQGRTTNLELVAIDHSHGLNAVRGHAASIQTDTNNIYGVLSRIDQRLELRELAESQKPYQPQ